MSAEVGGVSDQTMLPGGVRLIVIDDDVAICRQMASGLAKAGFQVVTANSADAAMAQVEVTPPDVAIVDLNMPNVGGLVVIRRLKELFPIAIHIIVLTGNDDEKSRNDAFEAGADDFVVKPVPMSEIRRRVAAAIRRQREYVQLRLSKEAAERRRVYGQEAAALLAHDLNNGLTISLSNLSFLVEEFKGEAEQADMLAAALRSVRRMAGLVANFVDIARFEDAAVKPRVAETKVHALLQSVIEVHAPSLQLTIDVECPADYVAKFDEGLVERVLHNLVGNAARYCKGGTITIGAKPWIDAEGIELWVSNTGPQVPDEIRGTLFEKYVQGRGGKRGMGLYFCRLVAEAHGGSIECLRQDKGPSFVLRLPGHG